jgi:filamentous hemagglutinin family protein
MGEAQMLHSEKTKGTTSFTMKPVVAALALALAAPAAFADNGMPGAGLVVRNVDSANGVMVNGTKLPGGNQILGLVSGDTIQMSTVSGASTVIQWGSPAVLDTANTAGFNIQAGKTLNVESDGAHAMLNIDISGNASSLLGTLSADANTKVFVANEKGISVGSAAIIVAPAGLGLIGGANLNTITAIDAFSSGAGRTADLNFTNAAGSVSVDPTADMSGVGTYFLVAGAGTVNVSSAPADTVPMTVVGGVGGSVLVSSGVYTENDSKGNMASLPTDVTLNVGDVATPYDASGSTVWAYGGFATQGVMSKMVGTVEYTGLLSNTGTIGSTGNDVYFGDNGTTGIMAGGTAGLSYGDTSNSGTLKGNNVYVTAGKNITNTGSVLVTSKGGDAEFWNTNAVAPSTVSVGGTVAASGTGNYIGYFSASNESANDLIWLYGRDITVSAPLSVSAVTAGMDTGAIDVYGLSDSYVDHLTVTSTGSLTGGAINIQGSGGCSDYSCAGSRMDVALAGNMTATNTSAGHTGNGDNGASNYGVGGDVELRNVGNVQGAGMITANRVYIGTYGSVNNPVSSNFLNNGLNITTTKSAAQAEPVVTFSSKSAGRQAINLNIHGDAHVSSGNTALYVQSYPYYYYNSAFTAGPNSGSSLIIQASGHLTIEGNNYANAIEQANFGGDSGMGGISNSNGFLFPGGVVFKSATDIHSHAVIDNAWTASAVPFQGMFFEAPSITVDQPMYTNANSWVNYSTHPAGLLPTVYGATQGMSIYGYPTLYASILADANHINTYSAIVDAAVNPANPAYPDWVSVINGTPIYF